MTAPPESFEKFRFTSDALPPAQRHTAVREVLGHTMGLDIDVFPDAPLHASFDFLSLPGLQTFFGDTLAVARRTPRYIADGTDIVTMALGTGPSFFLSQRGREHVVERGAGSLLLWSEEVVLRSTRGGHSSSLGLLLPRSALAPLVQNLGDTCGQLIPPGNEALTLLIGYVGALQNMRGLGNTETAHAVVRHVYDLIALAVGTNRDAEVFAAGRGLRAARLSAIKSHIAGNLRRHDLTVGAVAAHHHLTERYVQRLFETDGTTFSQFLLERRLSRARDLLGDPRVAGNRIGLIAFECGFGEISYFNRAFRRRYGASPSEIRKSGLAG